MALSNTPLLLLAREINPLALHSQERLPTFQEAHAELREETHRERMQKSEDGHMRCVHHNGVLD